MKFDCKGQHQRCKAKCCGIIDFEIDLWERNQDKVVRQPTHIQKFPNGKNIMPKAVIAHFWVKITAVTFMMSDQRFAENMKGAVPALLRCVAGTAPFTDRE